MRPRSLVVAVLLAVAGLVGFAGPASAHSVLVGSDPSDGATLGAAPKQLHLRLSEAVMPGTSKVRLTDGGGRVVDLGAITVGATAEDGATRIYRAGDPGAPTTITVDLPALAPDVYRIAWQTLSAADLHVTSGVIVFGVQRGVPAGAAGADDPGPPVVEVALRWLVLLGAGVAAGAVVVGRLGGGLLPRRTTRRVLVTGAAAAALGVAAGAGLVAVQAALDGAALADVLGSGYGVRWALRELAAAALAGACVAALAGRRRAATVAGAAGLALFAVTTALLGHAAAGGLGAPLRFAADVVHVGAALLWLGLLVGAVQLALDRSARPVLRPVLRRVGAVAAGGVAAVSVSGLLLAATQVASVDALLASTYGRLLLVKLAVAVVGGGVAVLVAGGVRGVGPAARGSSRLRALVAVEAAALCAVVLLGAGVASARPASGPEWVPASAATPIASGQAGDLVETVTVSPNKPGRNFVTVDVFQTRRPEPGPVTAVSAVLRRPGAAAVTVPLTAQGSGRWLVPTDALEAPGGWQVDVVVRRDGVGTSTATYPWVVADPAARLQRSIVSSAPLDLPLELAAGVLAAVVAAGALLLRRRRSEPPAGQGDPADAAGVAPPAQRETVDHEARGGVAAR